MLYYCESLSLNFFFIISVYPDAKFESIEENLNYLSDELYATHNYINKVVKMGENANLNKINDQKPSGNNNNKT